MRESDDAYKSFASGWDLPKNAQTTEEKVKGAHSILLRIQQEYLFQSKLLREILNYFPILLSHKVLAFPTQDKNNLSKPSLHPL